jgi:plastocyanin
MGRKLLVAAALVCAAVTPALAQGQSTATFTATDPHAWSANGTGANTLTITAPGTVTFEYPLPGQRGNGHNVAWESTPPPCDGNIPGGTTYGVAGWKGTCTFTEPGTYRFECKVHFGLMKGTVVVVAPTPEATATPTEDPQPTATPAPAPNAPQPPAAPTAKPATITVAASQKGTSVRGRVVPASRADVTVRLGKARVGHSVTTGTAFAVKLSASARRRLKRHALKLKVTVTTEQQTRTFGVRLRR